MQKKTNFSLKEVQSIVNIASTLEKSRNDNDLGDSFSIDEIYEIAKSSGISKDNIHEALSYLENREPNNTYPVDSDGIIIETLLKTKITSEQWDLIVAECRKALNNFGKLNKLGNTYEWSSEIKRKGFFQISVTPGKNSSKIQFYADYSKFSKRLKTIGAIFGFVLFAIFSSLLNLDSISNWVPAIINFSGACLGYFTFNKISGIYLKRKKSFLDTLLNKISTLTQTSKEKINFFDLLPNKSTENKTTRKKESNFEQ